MAEGARWLQTLSKQDSAGQGYSQERPRKAGLRTSSPKKRAAPRGPCAGLLSTNGSPAALCARVRWTKGRLSHRPSALLAGVRARAGLRMSGSMTPGDLGVNHRPGLSSTASRFTSFGGWHPLAKSGRFYLSIIPERGPVYAGRDTNAARDRPIAQGR